MLHTIIWAEIWDIIINPSCFMTEELPCNKQIALSYQVMWMDLHAICLLQGSSSVMNLHHQPIMLHDRGASLQQTNCSVLSGYVGWIFMQFVQRLFLTVRS
jgi:hypothetical protein